MVIAVLVLIVGSLHAQTRVDESKLSSLRYVKKTYKTKYKYTDKDGFYHYYFSSDRKAAFVKVKRPKVNAKIGVVNVDDEVYGRIVIHAPGIVTATCNLHDAKCSVKGKLAAYFTEEDAEDMTKEFKDLIIALIKTN